MRHRTRLFIACLMLLVADAAAAGYSAQQPLRKNAVKMTFLSWITGSTKICYERAWPGLHQASDVAVVCIGAGYDKYHNRPLGFSARYAHKFFVAWNNRQPLTGLYLRPEIIYTAYDYDTRQTAGRARSEMSALIGSAGFEYDWNHFIIDAYFGSGYAWGTPADTDYEHGFSLWNYLGTYNTHIAMTFGIRLGYSF